MPSYTKDSSMWTSLNEFQTGFYRAEFCGIIEDDDNLIFILAKNLCVSFLYLSDSLAALI